MSVEKIASSLTRHQVEYQNKLSNIFHTQKKNSQCYSEIDTPGCLFKTMKRLIGFFKKKCCSSCQLFYLCDCFRFLSISCQPCIPAPANALQPGCILPWAWTAALPSAASSLFKRYGSTTCPHWLPSSACIQPRLCHPTSQNWLEDFSFPDERSCAFRRTRCSLIFWFVHFDD